MKVIFQNEHGFITDFGEPQTLLDQAGGAVMEIPRYGVWKMDPRKAKHQVTVTTNDLSEAKAALGVPGSETKKGRVTAMDGIDVTRVVITAVLALAFYMLPTVAAKARRHRNSAAIALTNILLGWTVIGWIIALIWAFTGNLEPLN